MSADLSLLGSAALLVTSFAALYVKRTTVSLIMMFYASIVLGVIFSLYGGVLIGLFHIITFAGAVSVLLLSAVLMTGESDLRLGASGARLCILGAVLVAVAFASAALLGGLPSGAAVQAASPSALLSFVWTYRPWDLLILVMVYASSMAVVVNLFSKERA